MSKLVVIREALEKNPDIILVGPKEEKSLGEVYDRGDLNSHVNYGVAPKNSIYSISKLNEWFKNLIPALNPNNYLPFQLFDEDERIHIGFLRFDEEVGYAKTFIKRVERITDKDFLKNLEGFKNGIRVREEEREFNLERIICIHGCPNKELAERALEENTFYFDVKGAPKKFY